MTVKSGATLSTCKQSWSVAPGRLDGALYYTSYNDPDGEQGALGYARWLPGRDPSPVHGRRAQPSIFVMYTGAAMSGTGPCISCHSVSARGNIIAGSQHDYGIEEGLRRSSAGTSRPTRTRRSRRSPTTPIQSGSFVALTPDGSVILSHGQSRLHRRRGHVTRAPPTTSPPSEGSVVAKLWDFAPRSPSRPTVSTPTGTCGCRSSRRLATRSSSITPRRAPTGAPIAASWRPWTTTRRRARSRTCRSSITMTVLPRASLLGIHDAGRRRRRSPRARWLHHFGDRRRRRRDPCYTSGRDDVPRLLHRSLLPGLAVLHARRQEGHLRARHRARLRQRGTRHPHGLVASRLFIVDVAPRRCTPLDNANGMKGDGSAAIPNAAELGVRVLPDVMPVAAGGQFWLFWTSRRTYGNFPQNNVPKVAASPSPIRASTVSAGGRWGAPRHRRPRQRRSRHRVSTCRRDSGRHRALSPLRACKGDMSALRHGIDCCSAIASIGMCEVSSRHVRAYARQAHRLGRCCDKEAVLRRGFCAVPPPPTRSASSSVDRTAARRIAILVRQANCPGSYAAARAIGCQWIVEAAFSRASGTRARSPALDDYR